MNLKDTACMDKAAVLLIMGFCVINKQDDSKCVSMYRGKDRKEK